VNLSPHFTLEEAVFSSTALRLGINNTPSQDIIARMVLAAEGMEKVRSLLLGHPIHIDSWYRCPQLNSAIGGAKTSAHMEGAAVDFTCTQYGSPHSIVKMIMSSPIKFDQLIYEGRWVHISFKETLRQQVLSAQFTIAGTVYVPFKE